MIKKLYYKLVGPVTRVSYWSCTDFIHWVQEKVGMIPKPPYATSAEWKEWKTANEKTHPVWYWITDTGVDLIQDFVYFPHDVYYNFYYYFYNRFIHQTHKINTNLPPGRFYDIDIRMLNAMFQLIVEFVEYDKASAYNRWHSDDQIKNKRKAGLKYLDWEIQQRHQSPQQAEGAKQIKEIYLWIKDVRPYRPDPFEVSGLSEYYKNHDIFDMDHNTEECKQMREMTNDLEQKYEDEDTEMMIRIIKLRKQLWV